MLLAAVVTAAPALAQPALPPVITSDETGFTVRATRITTPMIIDGRLDEAVYERVPAISDYIQQEPKEGAPISERTESWVMFDDVNLYIVCRCWDSHPERIVANDMRRDSTNLRQNDNFGVVAAQHRLRGGVRGGGQQEEDDDHNAFHISVIILCV